MKGKAFILPIRILAMTLVCSVAAAQQSPEDIVKESNSLFPESKWQELSDYYCSDFLKDLRTQFMKVLDIVDGDDSNEFMQLFFGPGVTKEGLNKMSDKEFFENIVSIISLSSLLINTDCKVIGSVKETPSLVHVVERCESMTPAVQIRVVQMSVRSLRKDKAGWCITASGEMTGLIELGEKLRAQQSN